MKRDEILALAEQNPEALVTIIQRQEETIQRLEETVRQLEATPDPDNLGYHSLKGALFESLIVAEFLKYRFNKARESNLYFWRDQHGHEIDCIIEYQGRDLIPVEMKAGRTANKDYFNLRGSQQRPAGRLVEYENLDPVLEYLV